MAAEQARVMEDHGGNEETENQANAVRIFVAKMSIITMVMDITEAIITAESTMKMVTVVVIIMKVVNMNESLQGNHQHHHQPENKMVKDDKRKTSYAKALN